MNYKEKGRPEVLGPEVQERRNKNFKREKVEKKVLVRNRKIFISSSQDIKTIFFINLPRLVTTSSFII